MHPWPRGVRSAQHTAGNPKSPTKQDNHEACAYAELAIGACATRPRLRILTSKNVSTPRLHSLRREDGRSPAMPVARHGRARAQGWHTPPGAGHCLAGLPCVHRARHTGLIRPAHPAHPQAPAPGAALNLRPHPPAPPLCALAGTGATARCAASRQQACVISGLHALTETTRRGALPRRAPSRLRLHGRAATRAR